MNRGTIRLSATRRARRLVARFLPTAVVLAYHRVASPPQDPQLMCVSPAHFAEHLRVMRQAGECVSLRDLARWGAVGHVPRRAIVVTFDDGYADNLEVAEPLLRAAGVPATVFVASGGLDAGRPFWWDEIEALLLHGGEVPAEVTLTVRGRRFAWPLEAEDPSSRALDGPEVTRWDITRPETPSPRQAAYRDIARLCRGLAPDERDMALRSLVAQLGEAPAVDGHRRLSPAGVAELAASTVVEVGAHGVSHTPPSVLSPARRAAEFLEGKHQLEEMSGRAVDLLSYPFGAADDLTSDCGRVALDCGYMAACANSPRLVWRQSDPYRLPRFLVRDWDGEHFASRLEAWFEGAG